MARPEKSRLVCVLVFDFHDAKLSDLLERSSPRFLGERGCRIVISVSLRSAQKAVR